LDYSFSSKSDINTKKIYTKELPSKTGGTVFYDATVRPGQAFPNLNIPDSRRNLHKTIYSRTMIKLLLISSFFTNSHPWFHKFLNLDVRGEGGSSLSEN
jgi:hypothetical protein